MNATYVHSLQEATDPENLDALEELLREQRDIGGEVFRVPTFRMEGLRKKMEKLNRKASRLNTAPIQMLDSGERDSDVAIVHGIKRDVEHAYVIICGRTPVLNGWAFTATVEHTDHGNLIHSVPAYARPATMPMADFSPFRTTGKICQHCNKIRNRIDTYLVQNEDTGEVKQVGSSCLADFTGVNNPKAIAKWFEGLYEWRRWIGGGYSTEPYAPVEWDIKGFMATACAVVRNFGYVSGKTADETGRIRTTIRVKHAFIDGIQTGYDTLTVEQEDYDKAAKVIAHVRAMTCSSDYEHNVSTSLKGTTLTERQMGYAASAVILYDRATAPKPVAANGQPTKDEHYGVAGHTETFTLKVKHVGRWYESDRGFMTRKVEFADDEGRKFVWYTTSSFEFEVDKTYILKAKINGHGENKWGKFTKIGGARKVVEAQPSLI